MSVPAPARLLSDAGCSHQPGGAVQKRLCRLYNNSGPINRIHAQESGRGPVIVIQRAAQTFAAVDPTDTGRVAWFRLDDSVVHPLVVPLAMIMGHEILNSRPQGAFSKQDQSFQTGLL